MDQEAISRPIMAPTRSSFLASWPPVSGSVGYRIDVATDPAFNSYVSGYEGLDVGRVTNRIVGRLKPGTTYYYRVRSYDSAGIGASSEVMEATTTTGSGLVINPTFDASITSDPNADAIESTINQAIARYQPLFADPITSEIRFRYANTLPDGTPLPTGLVAGSYYVIYYVPWSDFIPALKADAKTTNDTPAYANFPGLPLTNYLVPSSAGGRALGLETPPAMFADGNVSRGGPYDGIVTLNVDQPFQFSRPPSSSNYDAQTAVEHEIDEVLGLGSYLGGSPEATDFRPEDLFSWSAPGMRSHSAVGPRYFAVDNGVTKIIDLSQVLGFDFGDWLSQPCPQANPYVQNAFGCKGQFADISATSPEAVALDVVGYDLVPAIVQSVLGNISTRSFVGTDDQVLIGGFIVTGTQSKKVVLRARGPSLPLDGVLADPYLEVHNMAGAIIASNDNWRSDQASEIIAAGFAPSNEAESAIIKTLQPGSYTAIVRGAQGGTGVGLVEIYDLDQTVDSKLANISTRSLVKTEDNVLIGGFIVLGDSPTSAILRAIGPSLGAAGVTDALQDPTLELHDSSGTLLATNDNWMDGPDQQTISDDGLAPGNEKESALLAVLPPGAYTVIVRGVSDTTGVALVEAYGLE
ncbi:MAG: fibronectin type III domain-containing protein [Chthoniobacterales bacterium]